MSGQPAEPVVAPPGAAEVGQLEARAQARLMGRVRDLRLSWRGDGLVLRGRAPTYYAKQLAQHAVLEATALPIVANVIEVCGAAGVPARRAAVPAPGALAPPAFPVEDNMPDWKKLKADILADGVIEDREVELIRQELYADGQIDREEVEFLIALRNEAQGRTPAFDALFFEALKQNVLADGSIDAEEAAWLRKMLFADGRIDEQERRFLRDLRREADRISPEFQALFDECVSGGAG